MDGILSEFVARTSADPGLAADLLDAHHWNLQSALSAYYVMKGILPGEVPQSETHSKNHLSSKYVDDDDDILDDNIPNGKKIGRGFSCATENLGLVTKARKEIAQDFSTAEQCLQSAASKLEIPDYTFTLPDFSVFPDSLREYLQRDLIETSTLVSLENAGRLNWWHSRKICKKLWPLATTGDGNCLLHAASLGMWGFHDRLLTLRKALHSVLTSSPHTDAFYRRWRWQTALQNKEAGLIYCEEEWQKEWKNILKMSSSEPRQRNSNEHLSSSSSGTQSSDCQTETYESLEDVHVLALAHVLKRAIIVIADTVLKDVTGEPFAPIPFGGIYLPLECPPSECHRSPLCLTYDSAHFSALVPMDEEYADVSPEQKAAIPVTDPGNKLLPLQFAVDPGPEVKWGQDENDSWVIARLTLTDKEKLILLNDYLDIRSIEVESDSNSNSCKEANGHVPSDDAYASDDSLPEGGISCTGGKHSKSKAARQLQTVAKQFGSIGRTMSKKLKHIGSIARRGSSFKGESSSLRRASENFKNKRTLSGLPMISRSATVDASLNPRQVIVAVLNTEKKHEYQKKLIQNYLASAIIRYENDKMFKSSVPTSGGYKFPTLQCINSGCTMQSSPSTSYLCPSCYKKQKQQEFELEGKRMLQKNIESLSDGPVFVSGKSAFYTEADKAMKESVEKLPIAERLPNGLCSHKNSIFYDNFLSQNSDVFPSTLLPEYKNESVRVDSHSMLKTIQESASS